MTIDIHNANYLESCNKTLLLMKPWGSNKPKTIWVISILGPWE